MLLPGAQYYWSLAHLSSLSGRAGKTYILPKTGSALKSHQIRLLKSTVLCDVFLSVKNRSGLALNKDYAACFQTRCVVSVQSYEYPASPRSCCYNPSIHSMFTHTISLGPVTAIEMLAIPCSAKLSIHIRR